MALRRRWTTKLRLQDVTFDQAHGSTNSQMTAFAAPFPRHGNIELNALLDAEFGQAHWRLSTHRTIAVDQRSASLVRARASSHAATRGR
jgi:hypothetical protein